MPVCDTTDLSHEETEIELNPTLQETKSNELRQEHKGKTKHPTRNQVIHIS